MSQKSGKSPEKYSFQAEVAQMLDIVINSLYTDKEIFIRELISNAADALEKVRLLSLQQGETSDDAPLEISIQLDKKKHIFTITDTGIGMTKKELIANLGSIAHSGSKEFLKKLQDNLTKDAQLIGQFGVGFYSAFMVAKKVTVRTRSHQKNAQGYEWVSTGKDGFTITPVKGLPRGTTISLELKDDMHNFAIESTVREAIRKFSNFVPFPIKLNGEAINTIQAIWVRNKSDIQESEYQEFYKFVSGDYEPPLTWLHFSTDAPLSIHAILYIPKHNLEKFGLWKTESNVDLHCRKVLIQKNAKGVLPPWLRFLRGVVDSEDIPLNISRETMQDSALLRKINRALTRKFIKFLEQTAKKEPEMFKTFWSEFGMFIKEGIISDDTHRDALAKLVRFETSKTEPGELISFDEYVKRMPESQKEIYYLSGASREVILGSPYMEVFRRKDVEVILNTDPLDDFMMTHLREYEKKPLVSAESEKLDITSPDKDEKKDAPVLTDKEVSSLKDWIKEKLINKVQDVRASTRLVDSPAILVNPMGQITGTMHRIMQTVNKESPSTELYILEFNPEHPVIRKLDKVREKEPAFAEKVLEQIFDNATISAGFTVNVNQLVKRTMALMERALDITSGDRSSDPDRNNAPTNPESGPQQ